MKNLRALFRQGGPGSGHHGHKGRPGQQGGSAKDLGGSLSDRMSAHTKYLKTADPEKRTPMSVLGPSKWDATDQREYEKGVSEAMHLKWKSSDLGDIENEIHETKMGDINIRISRGVDANGLDTYSVGFGSGDNFMWASENFYVDDEGLPDALSRAKAYAANRAPSVIFRKEKQKRYKRQKGPGISYSIYD